MTEGLARFILTRRHSILAGIGIVTLCLGYFAVLIHIDKSPEELIFQNDPEYPLLKAFVEP